MPNRLAQSTSPYLQQHKDNPVDWHIWGAEALAKAKAENKPIFLSIGYSSCHWCHVMERESFSDPEVAAILNANYVSIKVDREERPDLDHVYMSSVQIMAGQGGWPLNVFLTPDLKPFFGGTYFPPEARYGRPPFKHLLMELAQVYSTQSDAVRKNTDQLMALLIQQGRFFTSKENLDFRVVDMVLENLKRMYDSKFGGLGNAPKFFHVDGLRILLKRAAQDKNPELEQMAVHSLTRIACGGVYDQVGGGFHRYSTDAEWRVPHFEKMLYDNALLAVVYVEAWLQTKNEFFKKVAVETLGWALREMRSADGGFYSAIDADSEHKEGEFYVWPSEELAEALPGDVQKLFFEKFHVTGHGNFEGKNILYLDEPLSPDEEKKLKPALDSLLNIRRKRTWPLIDTKTVTSMNGLMISALARASVGLKEPKFLTAAQKTADFIWSRALRDGSLSHIVSDIPSDQVHFLEDYAYLAEGLLDLFEASAQTVYLENAKILAHKILEAFYDSEEGGFWTTPHSQWDLLVRFKAVYDGAVPAPYHVALSVLQRLFEKTGEAEWKKPLDHSIKAVLGSAEENPGGFQRFTLVLNHIRNVQQQADALQCTGEECPPAR